MCKSIQLLFSTDISALAKSVFKYTFITLTGACKKCVRAFRAALCCLVYEGIQQRNVTLEMFCAPSQHFQQVPCSGLWEHLTLGHLQQQQGCLWYQNGGNSVPKTRISHSFKQLGLHNLRGVFQSKWFHDSVLGFIKETIQMPIAVLVSPQSYQLV